MRSSLLLFSAGCAVPLFWPVLPANTAWPLLLLALGLLALQRRRIRTACLIAGLAWSLHHSQQTLGARLPEALSGQTVLVTGTVASLPEQDARRVRFLFDVQGVEGLGSAMDNRSESSNRSDTNTGSSTGNGTESSNKPDASTNSSTDNRPNTTWHTPARIRLNWYQNRRTLARQRSPQPGEQWQLQVRLKPPRGFMNPGGFDYETWLFSRRIAATGYVLGRGQERRLAKASGQHFNQLRHHIRARFSAQYADTLSQLGLIRALALGDRSAVTPEQWSLLRRTGTNHLLAISGLHIALVAGFVFWISRWLWAAMPPLTNIMPARRLAIIFSLLAALWYTGMAGFSLPAQRACIMLTLFLSGQWFGRQWRISAVLSVALAAVLLRDPLSLLAVDFWLSFTAVCIIAYAVHGRFPAPRITSGTTTDNTTARNITRRWFSLARRTTAGTTTDNITPQHFQHGNARQTTTENTTTPHFQHGSPHQTTARTTTHKWLQMIRLQCLIPLGLSPLLLLHFQELSLCSVFANLLAIPAMGFFIVPLIMLASLLVLCGLDVIASPLLLLADGMLAALFALFSWLGQWPHAFWTHSAPSLWAALLAGLGFVVLCAPAAIPGRSLGLFLFLPMLFPNHSPPPAQGSFHLHLLDVGQGLSVLVRTRDHTLIYDTGDAWSASFDAASSAIIPTLRQLGLCKSLDMLILSHGDRDHVGGAKRLIEDCPPQQVLSNHTDPAPKRGRDAQGQARPAQPLPGKQPDNQPCLAGHSWSWNGVHFSILHPQAGAFAERDNDRSCVLRISQPGMTALLPGDIEAQAEQQLLARVPKSMLATDILVAPHHGSRTSSSPAFLAATRPSVVLFPVGYGNRFGFPDQTIIRRYDALDARMYSSSESGSLSVRAAEGLVQVREHRRETSRFWHAPVTAVQVAPAAR